MPAKTRKRAPKRAQTTVGDVLTALDARAPFTAAADWDNVGLLMGDRAWPGAKICITLDLTDAVAEEALASDVDVIVVYHPPIFKPVATLTPDTPGPTRHLPDLLAAKISVIALHTVLDVAEGGTNDCLLDCFETVSRRPLETELASGQSYKLVTFVPANEIDGLRGALSAAGAGVIGAYSECSYMLSGTGTFVGDDSTNPTIGRKGRLETVDEIRLEMVAPTNRLAEIVRTLWQTHSYEEPAFDLYPLTTLPGNGRVGLGRIGRLARPTSGTKLAALLAEHYDLSVATVVGSLRRRFSSVAVAAGAFGVNAFRDPDTLVITGEFKHHDALQLQRRGVTAIHLGHGESERPALRRVRDWLRKDLKAGAVKIARTDRGPFQRLSI